MGSRYAIIVILEGRKSMAHISRREYRMKKQHGQNSADVSKNKYTRGRADDRRQFREARRNAQENISLNTATTSRKEHHQVQLNFWKIFSDRPYVAVALIVLTIFMGMIKFWWGLIILFILVIIGIFIIGRSHHPDRVLSLEFHMKASRKLSMLKALQLGGAVLMFLSTYMRQVVAVNFSSAGSTDSLNVVEGLLTTHGGGIGQQGAYFLSLLNTISGGSLWGSYRYATNSAQMMESSSGRWIITWIFLLMIAPAVCLLAQFFREPYSRNVTLGASIVSMIAFGLTPTLMRKWVTAYGVENNMSVQAASNAVSIGTMAYVAIACSILVFGIALYRFIKQDNFE